MRFIGGGVLCALTALMLGAATVGRAERAQQGGPHDGQEIFRFDTFGDEQLWTDTLRMNEVLAAVTPATALAVGLKVDADALPRTIIDAISAGQLDVNDPNVTLRLLDLNAVVGVVGKVAGDRLKSVGITCALCHSTVDDSIKPGIGKRLDGWPNSTLDVGTIVSLSPAIGDDLKAEFRKWGPGKHDPRHHIFDGKSIQIINTSSIPVVIPPAYGLQGVGFETYNGDGPIAYWNAYVGITQMGGQGTFSDPRIGVTVEQKPDRITRKLPALVEYELTLRSPPPPRDSFDPTAARRGQTIFNGIARCGNCHPAPTYTDVLRGPDPRTPLLHTPAEDGADPVYAARSATRLYRSTPLRALWQHPPYFHDGSAKDLAAVVDHYEKLFSLGLSPDQKADLIAFLKSL